MKYIEVKMNDGSVHMVRSELETGSPLTIHEIIINELHAKLKPQYPDYTNLTSQVSPKEGDKFLYGGELLVAKPAEDCFFCKLYAPGNDMGCKDGKGMIRCGDNSVNFLKVKGGE